ncbi:major histocompatibility complex class I-related gene protein-like isoform X4 [Ovis aries]|uniref:major histocompatibility complex class I-related gene protein-like isoform X4 n=1 Tax=Ovis aries TaxID=9940 RepID=UPI00295292A4|nr:major histocompatibility complex class I-related gene protein-like isoform X4 [Ovis aries]
MSQTRLSDFTFTFHFHALEKEMATYSSVLAWRIPGTGEPGWLLSMGSHRVGHHWKQLSSSSSSPSAITAPPFRESPWGLPLVADGPASMAKVVMAELTNLKLENKSWPRVCVSTGTHSLRYHYLYLSEPGPSLPKFLAVGYVDDQPFIRYDSRVDKAEPQAPWITPMNAKYWEKETKKQRKWAEIHQVETWQTMGYHNHSSGMHSTHRMFGCEIQEDGHFNSFWRFGYDGQDHVSLDMETLSWVSANPVALLTKRRIETEHCYAEYDKAYLEGPCLASLHRYLELGGQRVTRREMPSHPGLRAGVISLILILLVIGGVMSLTKCL